MTAVERLLEIAADEEARGLHNSARGSREVAARGEEAAALCLRVIRLVGQAARKLAPAPRIED
jgi:hypothetical protein